MENVFVVQTEGNSVLGVFSSEEKARQYIELTKVAWPKDWTDLKLLEIELDKAFLDLYREVVDYLKNEAKKTSVWSVEIKTDTRVLILCDRLPNVDPKNLGVLEVIDSDEKIYRTFVPADTREEAIQVAQDRFVQSMSER